jgi:hypothetical protein
MAASPTPAETRAQDSLFVRNCSLQGLGEKLPLRWPTPPDTPPAPKKGYRSNYRYMGWEDLQDPANWEGLSDFDLILRLVDFSGLRPVLAQRLGWTSAKGRRPLDPVSFFLLIGWQITNGWPRSQVLENLCHPRYADYAQRFGFQDGVFPTEGGVRHFLTTLGHNSEAEGETIAVQYGEENVPIALQQLNQLIKQSVELIRDAGILSSEAWEAALIGSDGQLHDAASRMRCSSVTDSCYQPTSSSQPRPCPAKEKDKKGCDCDTQHCTQACRRATPRDQDARFVWYDHSNQGENQDQGKQKKGEGRYGYRSLPLQLADSQRRCSITLLDDLLSANQREEIPASAQLLQLGAFYPDLEVAAVTGDAGFGFEVFLHTIYHHLKARRVVDLRAHQTDRDTLLWPTRGYDDEGRPICSFGYAFVANGFDYEQRRHKWVCRQACLKQIKPRVELPDVAYPPPNCPYQCSAHPNGEIRNIAERFPDGSIRLVRDVPVGSSTWKRLYHRGRNAVEGRNSTMEAWGFKRMSVYGKERVKATIFQADVWANLTTLARLIREATSASRTTSILID